MFSRALDDVIVSELQAPHQHLRISVRPLRGGLESRVARARLTSDAPGVPARLIVKTVRGRCRRESEMYRLLGISAAGPPTPALLGVHADGDADHLYLEDVHPSIEWPWADIDLAGAVCRALAALHRLDLDGTRLAPWDYELELLRSAEQTLQLAQTAGSQTAVRVWARLGDLRRVVRALPYMRARLASQRPVVIHGDVHPGNVLVRNDGPRPSIVLIDWARARYGSPFEDLASWLQSLGCWEREARRRHDSLFKQYLRASGSVVELSASTRTLYWYAAASNGLAGAIRYHLAVLGDSKSSDRACALSGVALRSWQRVIRRAAALVTTVG